MLEYQHFCRSDLMIAPVLVFVLLSLRSRGRRSWRSRSRSHSRSVSRSRRRAAYSQRDRWKREPSHSPILVLRKNRSPTRKHSTLNKSPQRISELGQEIIKSFHLNYSVHHRIVNQYGTKSVLHCIQSNTKPAIICFSLKICHI